MRGVTAVLALALACAACAAPPTDGEAIEALIHAGMVHRAKQLVPLSRDVPPELASEVAVRIALERGERRELERVLRRQPDSPMVRMGRAVLALERGQLSLADSELVAGFEMMSAEPRRPLWEMGLLRATVLFRQGRTAAALQQLLAMPDGDGMIPWSPYVQLLSATHLTDSDRPRLLRRALHLHEDSPDLHFHALRQALFADDLAQAERAFLEHARLRAKRTHRARVRRFDVLPVFPVTAPARNVPRSELFAEFAWVGRERPDQVRACEQMTRIQGTTPLADWLFARAAMSMANFEEARGILERLQPIPHAAPELASVLAWTGEPKRALAELARVPPDRAKQDDLPLIRARALADLDPAAAASLLAKQEAELGQLPEFWLVKALLASRRGAEAEVEQALDQLVVLRKMGRIQDTDVLRIATKARPLKRPGFAVRLSNAGRRTDRDAQWDARPASFSALVYRLLADRASIDGDGEAALALLDRARAAMEVAVTGRMGLTRDAVARSLDVLFPRLAREMAYPLALVTARVWLQVGNADRALRALRPFLADGARPSVPYFLLMAAAAGQSGDRVRTNVVAAAGTLIGSRPGAPWGAYAQLLVLTGSDEALHALARSARAYHDAADDPDDLVAVSALGGLYADALAMTPPAPALGTALGHGLAHAAEGRLDEARRALAQAAAEPGAWRSPALLALVQLAAAHGRFDEARAHIATLEAAKVADHRLPSAKALLALEEGRLDDAAAEIEQARRRGAHAVRPHLLAGRLARARKTSPLPALEEAVRVAPHVAEAWEALAVARADAGQDGRAALREAARQALDAGEVARARRVLFNLAGQPPLPARPLWPRTEPRALALAFERIVRAEPTPQGAMDAAREGALHLVLLGEDAAALRLLELAAALAPATAAAAAAPAGAAPLVFTKPVAALVMSLVLLLFPAVAGRGLRRAVEP